jgi:hypothetical protein
VLTMRGLTNSGKTMALYNALKAFPFADTNNINKLSLNEYIGF